MKSVKSKKYSKSIKIYGVSLIVFIVVILVFSLGAIMEYRHVVEQEQKALRDELNKVRTNIETMITSRIINANGVAGFVKANESMDQDLYGIFAEGIYNSEPRVVKDVVFITDTTISHVYPRYYEKDAVGVDLALNDAQREILLYTKENLKTVFLGPVDLVEGGKGIVIRVPVIVDDLYYGQIAIVFDYYKFIEASGLKGLTDHNFVRLQGNNPKSNLASPIWYNNQYFDGDYVTTTIQMYDVEWSIDALPYQGWNGYSNLFYTIFILGVLIAGFAAFAHYKQQTLKNALIELNTGLQRTVAELADSENELFDKYEEVKEQEAYIQRLADHDELTGLCNRRLFEEKLESEIALGNEGTVLLVDIDDFKNINDIYGHVYGDKLLKKYAEAVKEATVGLGHVYRFGGDEFLIVVDKKTTQEGVIRYIDAIKDESGELHVIGVDSHITVSVGAVTYPADGNDVESLLIRADVAMYASKRAGKNQVTFFEKAMLEDLDLKITIEKHVKSCIANQGFMMHYQPIIDAKSGVVVSFEALIRLKDHQYTPITFIDVAESSGLIVPLGDWIFEEVFSQIARWIEQGIDLKPIAINLSPRQLIAPEFLTTFFKLLEAYQVPVHMIEIEITENVLLKNEYENIKILNALRDAGIRISLDDFGTGYSSLKYLTYLPIDKVKIDKSLKDEFLNMDNSEVLFAIITMVHGLGLQVVAEGIERIDEWEKLRLLGCDYLQGYYFSQPMDKANIPAILEKCYLNEG